MPVGAETFPEGLRWGAEIYHVAEERAARRGPQHHRRRRRRLCAHRSRATKKRSKSSCEAIEARRLQARRQMSASRSTPPCTELYENGKYNFAKRRPQAVQRRDGRLLGRVDRQVPDHLHRRRHGRRRLGRLEAAHRRASARKCSSSATTCSSPTPSVSKKASSKGVQLHPHQGQPDRHPHRNDRGHRDGPASRLDRRHLPPLRRNRRHHHRRPRRRPKCGQIKTGAPARATASPSTIVYYR